MRMRTVVLLGLGGLVMLGPGPATVADEGSPPIVLTDVTATAVTAALAGDRFSLADYDRDGDPDLLINGKTLLRNDTKPQRMGQAEIVLTDVSAESGIQAGPGGGACWVDVDGDGALDVVTQNGALKLQVAKGRFEDRATAWGLPEKAKASTVGVGDVDGDRRPDLLFGGGEDWNDGNATFYARRLYRNVDGKRFEEVTKDHELEPARYGRAVVWADFDTDGDQDVYLGNYRLQPNELLVNEAGVLKERGKRHGVQGRHEPEKFEDAKSGKRYGFQYGHTIASSWSDLDGDGDLDLWVSNLVHKFVGEGVIQGKKIYDIRGYICDDSAIYQNQGAPEYRFADLREEAAIPKKPIGDRGVYRGDELWSNAACGDLDGDGLPEVYVAQVYQLPYSYAHVYRNIGLFRFEEISTQLKLKRFNSYGGAFADLDGDGDLDLVCGGSPTPKGKRGVCILRNDTKTGPWVAFELRGRAPGTTALGAQVTVITDKGRFVRQVESCMGSHAQQNEPVLRFGLRGQIVKRAIVRWPGNVIEEIESITPGQVHIIPETRLVPPTLHVEMPKEVFHREPLQIKLKTKGRGRKHWVLTADIDGNGTFEALPKKNLLTCSLEAPLAEVRVRLSHDEQPVHLERVLRIPVKLRPPPK